MRVRVPRALGFGDGERGGYEAREKEEKSSHQVTGSFHSIGVRLKAAAAVAKLPGVLPGVKAGAGARRPRA
jgi:hypothetical protein